MKRSLFTLAAIGTLAWFTATSAFANDRSRFRSDGRQDRRVNNRKLDYQGARRSNIKNYGHHQFHNSQRRELAHGRRDFRSFRYGHGRYRQNTGYERHGFGYRSGGLSFWFDH